MSTNSISLLITVSQQVVIYLGLFLVGAGVIGGILNLIIFSSLKTFRQSSCAFYLTIMSLVNIFHLFTGPLTFIMINGFGINWTNMSLFYCKFRAFYVQICVLTSLTCICLATIDQFLATCSHPRWRQWNNIKTARYIMIGAMLLWLLHGIPFAIYYNENQTSIMKTPTCMITNVVFQQYNTFIYICVISTSLPISIMIIFGVLGYRNVKQIAYRTVPLVRRELDKQLTEMVLMQAFCDVLFVTPIFISNAFNSIVSNPNDPSTQILIRLIRNVTTTWYSARFMDSFYIYVCASKRFRQQLIHVLFTVHWNRWYRRGINNNQIEPQI